VIVVCEPKFGTHMCFNLWSVKTLYGNVYLFTLKQEWSFELSVDLSLGYNISYAWIEED
jgi:hypothetical protein